MNTLKISNLLRKVNLNYSLLSSSNIQYKAQQLLSTNSVNFTKLAQDQKPDWNKAVSEAEKIVGYPTSFLSLRWLLSDEVANVALHLRKLVGSNHPLLKTAKTLLYTGKNNMQAWGLIVLLISKAAGHSPNIPDLEQDKAAGVLHSQRALAEIAEMIRTSHLVHKGLVNINPSMVENENDMMFGNKIALLSGDYLLSNCCIELAGLRNQELVELIGAALRDQTESEFVGPRDNQNNPLPARPNGKKEHKPVNNIGDSSVNPLIVMDALGNAQAEWTLRHVLSGGSLLGKSCQSALKLAGHPESLQEQAYIFGKHLALAWQACLDREPFQNAYSEPFSLVSAPVLFQLEHDPSLYAEVEKGMDNVLDVDYKMIYEAVLSGSGLEKARQLQKENSQAALDVLQQFPQSDARTALTNIIFAMQEF